MGLYNIIRSELTCPGCHAPVEWQSKELDYDGLIIAEAMQVIELRPLMDGEMHTSCRKCKTLTRAIIRNGNVVDLETSTIPPSGRANRDA